MTDLLGEPDSGIEKVRQVVHVAIHPKYVNNIPLGLVNYFNKQINQWHPQLNGILAGYGRLQLKRPTGALDEEAHLHLDVQSDFWLFRPLIGRQLKGVVSKKSNTHVSVLLHGVFSVPCHKPHNVNDWWGAKAKLKQAVRLTVLKTDMSQKVPFIMGSLNNIGIGGSAAALEISFEETVPSPRVEEFSDNEWSEITSTEVNTSKKAKKSRKKADTSVVDETPEDPSEADKTKDQLISSLLNESNTSKKAKKSRKSKNNSVLAEEPSEVKTTTLEDASEVDKTKELLISSLLNESMTKKKKKKKDKELSVEVPMPQSPSKRKSVSPIKETPARKKSKKEMSFDASTPIVEKAVVENGDDSINQEPKTVLEPKKKKDKKEKKKKAELSSAQDALIMQMLKNLHPKK